MKYLSISIGISGDLFTKGTFYFLDDYYKYFTFAVGPNPEKNFVLQITNGGMIKNWKNGQIMDCYVSLKLFGWWHWDKEGEDDILYMYFDDKTHLTDAKKWLENKYSNNIKVWEVREKKRKNSFKK